MFEAAAMSTAELRSAAGEARVIADQLLDRSGATRIVQESGARLDSIQRIAGGL